MIGSHNLKHGVSLNPTSTTNAATATGSLIDTQGFHTLEVLCVASTAAGTNLPTVLKLQESDTTVTANFVDIVAFTGGTAVDATHGFVIPAPSSSTNNSPFALFSVQLNGRKRYIQPVFSPVATQVVGFNYVLGRPDTSPTSATAQNISGIVVTG